MSVPSTILSMYEDMYEECLAEATKKMFPLGCSPAEIHATAQKDFEEKCDRLEYIRSPEN